MNTMKYIIVETPMNPWNVVIFSENLSHADVYRALFPGKFLVVGAGSCSHHPQGIVCYGGSQTLGVDSREIDSQIVSRQLGCDY
jgi:hypothetical protein